MRPSPPPPPLFVSWLEIAHCGRLVGPRAPHWWFFFKSLFGNRGLHFFSSLSLGMATCLISTNEKWMEIAFHMWVRASHHQHSVTQPSSASASRKAISIRRGRAGPPEGHQLPWRVTHTCSGLCLSENQNQNHNLLNFESHWDLRIAC